MKNYHNYSKLHVYKLAVAAGAGRKHDLSLRAEKACSTIKAIFIYGFLRILSLIE